MKKILVLLSSTLVLVTNSYALDSVRISGYATAAGGYISDSTVGATTQNANPGHDDYTEDSVKFEPDSVAGLQISSRVADDVTVSMQLVGQFDNEQGSIELDWAYINYELSDAFTIQAGRFVPQVFLYSNTINVGFSYLWITPPSEVYGQAPMRYTDGANLLLEHTFSNDVTIEASAYASNVSQDINFAGHLFPSKFENFYGGSASISNEYFKLRAGHMEVEMTTTLNDSLEGGNLIAGPNNQTTATMGLDNTDGIKAEAAKGKFSSVGLTLDVADIIVIGEYAVRNIEDSVFTEDTTSYYATLGYRIGNFTPHITYSVLETEFKDSSDILTIYDQTSNSFVALPTPQTVGTFRSALSTDSETIALGLRYELNSKTALKFEYQNINKTPQEIDYTTGDPLHEETSADLYKIALSVIF